MAWLGRGTLLHQIAVRRIGLLADVRGRIAGGAEAPEAGGRSPVAQRAAADEASRRVRGDIAGGVGKEQRLRGGINAQLVHLQVAKPAGQLVGVRAEHADINLVQVRTAHVHAHRQCRGGKHAVHRLHFVEDRGQRVLDGSRHAADAVQGGRAPSDGLFEAPG